MDWEPTYNFELIGGSAGILNIPTNDVRVWCVGVPDLTPAQGGTKVMVSGINFRFKDFITLDGRVVKRMTYSPTYHSNKMRKIVTHEAGEKHRIEIVWEHYKV